MMENNIYHKSFWINTQQKTNGLNKLFEKFLRISGFNILNFAESYFEPQGYTAIWILAESHLAIHTFPENSSIYIDISSCSEIKMNEFVSNLENNENTNDYLIVSKGITTHNNVYKK